MKYKDRCKQIRKKIKEEKIYEFRLQFFLDRTKDKEALYTLMDYMESNGTGIKESILQMILDFSESMAYPENKKIITSNSKKIKKSKITDSLLKEETEELPVEEKIIEERITDEDSMHNVIEESQTGHFETEEDTDNSDIIDQKTKDELREMLKASYGM